MSRTRPVPLGAALLLSLIALAPLLPPLLAGGPLRIALQPHPTLAPILEIERALTIRPFAGGWVLLAVVAWFGLAFRSRQVAWWEGVLVLLGGLLALPRLGNAWVLAIALLPPLAKQLRLLRLPLAGWSLLAIVLIGAAAFSAYTARARPLSVDAVAAVASIRQPGAVFAAQPWATDLQSALGSGRQVLGSGDPWASPPEFWTEYLRISHAHLTWAELLDRHAASAVVLDEAGSQSRAAAFVRRQGSGWRVLYDRDGILVAEREAG